MITYEEIAKANEAIKTMTISRTNRKTGEVVNKEYAEVNQRIKAFRMVYPIGCISTAIVKMESGTVLMRADVYDGDNHLLATGYAQEKEGSSQINQTSYVENCETSAIGRALGVCGFGIDAAVASYNEVKNAKAQKTQKQTKVSPLREVLIDYCQGYNINMTEIAKKYHLSAKSTDEEFQAALNDLEKNDATDSK